jgi:hypothetical protein
MAYQAQYDKQARGWNVVEVATGRIVGMFNSRKQAERSAELSSRLEAAWGA